MEERERESQLGFLFGVMEGGGEVGEVGGSEGTIGVVAGDG